MLCDKWSSPGVPHVVGSADFLPPNHRSSKGEGVLKKHLAVCVAAHLSPFYAKMLELRVGAERLIGKNQRTRRKNPFAGAVKPTMARKKRRGAGDGGKIT